MTEKTHSYNLLQNNGFLFSLARIPETVFRVTSCNVPGISIQPVSEGFPGATQYFPGSNSEFEELSLEFLVDEDLTNYEEIYHWITQQRYASIGDKFVPKNDKELTDVSDGTLVTMTNQSNPNRVFAFRGLFPISLGTIRFDTTVDQPQPVRCQVTFRYSYFELIPMNSLVF